MELDYEVLRIAAIGTAIVVVSDLIGNLITFKNRFVNALVTGLIFGAIFAGVLASGFLTDRPILGELLVTFVISGILTAFASDFIGNNIFFQMRALNTAITGVVFFVIFYLLIKYTEVF